MQAIACERLGNTRITVVERSCRRVRIHLAMLIGVEGRLVERASARIAIRRNNVGLPTNSAIDRKARGDVPGILHIQAKDILTEVGYLSSTLAEGILLAGKKVNQRFTNIVIVDAVKAAIKAEVTVLKISSIAILTSPNVFSAKSKLMFSFHIVDVVGIVLRIRIEVSRRASTATDRKVVRHGETEVSRHVGENIHSYCLG